MLHTTNTFFKNVVISNGICKSSSHASLVSWNLQILQVKLRRNRRDENEYYTCYEGMPLSQGAQTAFDGGEDVFRRVGEGLSFIFSGRYVYFWRQLKIFTAAAKNEFSARREPIFN